MCKREYLLQLAHIQCGFHQGQKRTLERIRLSGLYFPGIKEAVYSFCNQCRPCAQARGVRKLDRVPITPIPRAEVPGQYIFMDVIGPIEPSSGNFKYLLCTVDSCTSWPTVYLLRNLTAKAVCECLCDLFSFLGVAAVISSDQGSNFTSQLTKLFLEKMGCAPRWASPAHPEASGKVERFNASFKRMLHHVILDNPSSWHKYVPFMTWAMRECSNATPGVPPYTLLFGRLPRGPLAVLRDSWQGDIELPVGLGKSAEQYLHDLHAQLKRVHEYAGEHASVAQERYAKAYNKHARPKSFEVDEEVIVLYPDSTNKLRSRWQIGIIVDVRSNSSYLVKLPDGSVRQIHVNKLRPFHKSSKVVKEVTDSGDVLGVSVNSVILEQDSEFGSVYTVPVEPSLSLPSQRIDPSHIAHLTRSQQVQLLAVLDRFPECFDEKPGLCTLVEHEIIMSADFIPRRARAYKVPESLKEEVDKQIPTLLKDGFIRHSSSPQASPIVCVLKKVKVTQENCLDVSLDKSSVLAKPEVRLAIDFRYLNSFTQAFPFPVPDQQDALDAISRFNVISVFDLRASYWQTPIKREHQWLSAFVCHSGLYEWCRTPYGMKNSGSTLLAAIQSIIAL